MSYLGDSYNLPQNQFDLLRNLIHQRLGLYYENGRRELLQDRLAVRLAEQGLTSFLDYYYLLKYDPKSDQEWLKLQSTLAVRETYFFREYDQIRTAVEKLIPNLQSLRNGGPVRIWSAACASGEEPYTLAIALQQAGCYQAGTLEILATDFDTEALQLARQGIYRERSLRAMNGEQRQQYFAQLPDGRWQLAPSIRRMVNFNYLNLMDEAGVLAMRGMDVIFCRNAFIYFSDEAIHKVTGLFHQVLQTPGYLLLGAAESLLKFSTPFELIEIQKTFVYSKQA